MNTVLSNIYTVCGNCWLTVLRKQVSSCQVHDSYCLVSCQHLKYM